MCAGGEGRKGRGAAGHTVAAAPPARSRAAHCCAPPIPTHFTHPPHTLRGLPRGMYLSLADKGSVSAILKNWPQRRVKAICLTDGERCGTLGDLGVQASACARGARRRVAGCTHAWVWCGGCGCARAPATKRRPPPPPTLPPSLSRLAPQAIGMPISRLALYTAVGGVVPSACMPVTIDCGTDNDALLQARSHAGAVCVIVCMPARCSCLPAPLPARPPALPPTCLPGGPPAALHGPALCRTLCPPPPNRQPQRHNS